MRIQVQGQISVIRLPSGQCITEAWHSCVDKLQPATLPGHARKPERGFEPEVGRYACKEPMGRQVAQTRRSDWARSPISDRVEQGPSNSTKKQVILKQTRPRRFFSASSPQSRVRMTCYVGDLILHGLHGTPNCVPRAQIHQQYLQTLNSTANYKLQGPSPDNSELCM